MRARENLLPAQPPAIGYCMNWLRLFSAYSACLITVILSTLPVAAERKVTPRAGVLRMSSGYYIPFGKKDRLDARRIKTATNAAQKAGFVTLQEYAAKMCSPLFATPHLLVPTEVRDFDFQLHFEGDRVTTSYFTLQPGIYKATLRCFTVPTFTSFRFSSIPESFNIGSQSSSSSKIYEISKATRDRIEIADSTFSDAWCSSGQARIERLEERASNP